MPAWDQQELKVHPRYQLDPSPAVVITTQFATSEESAKTSKVAVVKLYQWQRPVFTSSAQITSSSERSPLRICRCVYQPHKRQLESILPGNSSSPPIDKSKVIFFWPLLPPSTPNPPPKHSKQTAQISRDRAHIFAFSPFPHIFLIFPCFPRTRRRADEYKYLGASHCYSLGRLSHISCKSCPPPGSQRLSRFISCPTTTWRLRLS